MYRRAIWLVAQRAAPAEHFEEPFAVFGDQDAAEKYAAAGNDREVFELTLDAEREMHPADSTRDLGKEIV